MMRPSRRCNRRASLAPPLVAAIAALAIAIPGHGAEPPNLAQALEAQQLLAADSPTPEVLTDLGNLLVMAGRVSEAESTYRRVMSMDPSHAGAPFNLGLVMQYRGESDIAFDLYQQVIALDSTHAWAHYQTGAIHEAAARRQEAIEAYARALALDPQLYFADVNPQIVNNELVTEALLQAAKLRQPSLLAPMSFSRPREITRLLLSLPATEDAEEPATDQED